MMHEAAQDVAAQSWVKGNERKCAETWAAGGRRRAAGEAEAEDHRRWACILSGI